ncbi:VanZ family protein [Catenovulum sp. SX2]|uniref:VanZ family protein n=1 Tax=Catenovulum sp. SX2 TaxID=3398614 RepID=UPI003F85325F
MWTKSICIAFICFIVWVIAAANSGANLILFQLVAGLPYGDKLGHFVIFLLITICAELLLKSRRWNFGRMQISAPSILVASFVILEEFSQLFIDNRTFDWLDLIASLVGVIIASWLTHKRTMETRHL